MKIVPTRGLNVGSGTAPVHAPAGVPVEVSDKLGKELIGLGVATLVESETPAVTKNAPPVETAEAPAASENASLKKVGKRAK
jgi:hypothetical protein